jgi:predicted phosphodiesterase
MRVFAISDLHTDFKANKSLLEQLSLTAYQQDVLLVAGDIADRLSIIAETLVLLRARFAEVFYVLGNHELWVRNQVGNSLEKLYKVIRLCDGLGIRTRPDSVGNLRVVPLFSWYDESFDVDGTADLASLEGWADRYFCKWPSEIEPVAQFFLRMNESRLNSSGGLTISLSHFLPRRDLLPPTESLRFKGLPRVAGCLELDEQIRRLGSSIHVFGHTHINCDLTLDGVRYVQNALKYPKEHRTQPEILKLILDTTATFLKSPDTDV